MAAVALTKTEGKPGSSLAATRIWESDPSWAWYTAGAIGDTDTTTFANWTGPIPVNVRVVPVVTTESASARAALSGTTLTITYQTDGAITAGALVGIKR